ncbi:NAD(P)/FAD-dependent oxidoreductase [Phreatobacter stygius]|uniref:FAD-binding oxidoreductase n=1 Tax=Phreatobacter stygius TaxID=1940610 RepID=A0A4D7B415_9HYPH|nr:FAD-dependent oxidoreductase [Phreatobacter stygius]QCI62872.1 FAD-binding oxidoreductase [Phreatobacter stygius]
MTAIHDVLVLGAGMVGVSAALEARRRGLSVVLVDRRGPGEETSYGNSGVIDGGNLYPVAMPRDLPTLFKHALNRQTASHYHLAALPRVAGWMFDYWRWSAVDKLEETARVMRPFFAEAVGSHREFAKIAGAERFFRQDGWLELYRLQSSLDAQERRLKLAKEYGLNSTKLSMGETLELEPHLKGAFAGAIWQQDSDTVSSPGGVTKAYAEAFVAAGGRLAKGDAMTLAKVPEGFAVDTDEGRVLARQAVVALGIWSKDLVAKFGYSVPLAAKRGYHRHYQPKGNAFLSRQVCDEDVGYVLCPMEQGIRLTTGVEIALAEAPKTPVQVERAFRAASDLFDLGEPVEAEPWMGRRPATPDSRPIIGPAPGHEGLWFAFGHGHWGFTLGPATAKALLSAMSGEPPHVDLTPYRMGRWG